jgi:hypothetical protein
LVAKLSKATPPLAYRAFSSEGNADNQTALLDAENSIANASIIINRFRMLKPIPMSLSVRTLLRLYAFYVAKREDCYIDSIFYLPPQFTS